MTRAARPEIMTRALFICSQNLMRSPTAEAVFGRRPGVEAASAGVHREAERPVSVALLEWADLVLVMEHAHRRALQRRLGEAAARRPIVVLDIPDRYPFMHPELVRLLEDRVSPHLRD